MYTAKIIDKKQDEVTRSWAFIVEFSNGDDTFSEKVYPQDAQGFDYWLSGRLQSLNALTELVEADNLNKVIGVPAEPTPEELEAKQAQEAKAEWLKKKLILSTMIDDMEKGKKLGITPNDEQIAIMQNLATWVNANMKQEYYF